MKKVQSFPCSTPAYTIELAVPSSLPHVLQIMRDNFYYEEVIFQALSLTVQMTNQERKITSDILDETIKAAFDTSRCLVAVHSASKKIVGVNITTISKNPNFGAASDGLAEIFLSNKSKSKLVDQYYHYLSDMNERANLFAKYPMAREILEFYAIAIDKNHRKIGLAENLIKAGVNLAENMENVALVFGVFTSRYSTKSAEKAGMNCILEFDLLDYKDHEGKTIFLQTKPHNITSVMAIEVKK